MIQEILYVLSPTLIVFFGAMLLLNEKKHHEAVMTRQDLISGNITICKQSIVKFEEVLSEYRNKYIEHNKDLSNTHEHLQKVTDQMLRLNKAHRILKQGLVKRVEVVIPNDFKSQLRKVADKMEQFA